MDNPFGFTRKDLAEHGVLLTVDVNFKCKETAPPELRKLLGEAAVVLHKIAHEQIMRQLRWDALAPNNTRDVLYGEDNKGTITVLQDSGWK